MGNDWAMLLEQKEDMSITSGSIADVSKAVRRGADLRVYMTTPVYDEWLGFQQTYAGEGDAFAGMVSHHNSFEHKGSIVEQPYICLFQYQATGHRGSMKWLLGDKVINESWTTPPKLYGVYRWYVCDRWRLVYENDASGNRITGDLDELKQYIKEGRSVRAGIRQLNGLVQDDTSGPEHISFLTTMLSFIWDGHVVVNCDPILIGPPKWPYNWTDGLHWAMARPSTAGEFVCYFTEPGKTGSKPFTRVVRRRGIQWYVSEKA